MFLYNVSAEELFQERKIWDRVCLRNVQSLQYSIRFFTVTWPNVAQIIGIFQKIFLHKNYWKTENYETR